MKSSIKYLCLTLLMVGTPAVGVAQDASGGAIVVTCSKLEDERERLNCFDRLFPQTPATSGVYSGPATIDPVPRSRANAGTSPGSYPVETAPIQSAVRAEEPVRSETVAVQPATQAPAGPEPFSKGGLFSWKEKVDFESKIVGLLDNQQTKMVFRLANDQIWIQSSPRSLPIEEGDMVTVKTTRFGGHVMRTENGTTTRVQRIQ